MKRRRWTGKALSLWVLCRASVVFGQQQGDDPRVINGGSVLAMAGKECVAVAMDKRFGSGPQMVNIAPRHVLTPHASLLVAFTGLEGDIQTLSQDLELEAQAKLDRALGFRVGDIDGGLSENRLTPRAMASLTSHVLWTRRRYAVEPLVVGLQPSFCGKECEWIPYLCSMDMIGAKSSSSHFICGGAAAQSLYGTAEALWRPNMEEEELVETCGRAFTAAMERDCFSGYGTTLFLISKQKGLVEYDLASRND